MREKKICLLCGVKGIRQPVIKTDVVLGYYIPIADGGKRVQRNMFSICKFHKRLYQSWATDEERKVAKQVIQKHLKSIYEDWVFTDCLKEEENK